MPPTTTLSPGDECLDRIAIHANLLSEKDFQQMQAGQLISRAIAGIVLATLSCLPNWFNDQKLRTTDGCELLKNSALPVATIYSSTNSEFILCLEKGVWVSQ